MSWTSSPVSLLEKRFFVSALCQFVPMISPAEVLILISKIAPTESRYDLILAFQQYFGITKNFLMRLFGSRTFTYGLTINKYNNNKADSITVLPGSFV